MLAASALCWDIGWMLALHDDRSISKRQEGFLVFMVCVTPELITGASLLTGYLQNGRAGALWRPVAPANTCPRTDPSFSQTIGPRKCLALLIVWNISAIVTAVLGCIHSATCFDLIVRVVNLFDRTQHRIGGGVWYLGLRLPTLPCSVAFGGPVEHSLRCVSLSDLNKWLL